MFKMVEWGMEDGYGVVMEILKIYVLQNVTWV